MNVPLFVCIVLKRHREERWFSQLAHLWVIYDDDDWFITSLIYISDLHICKNGNYFTQITIKPKRPYSYAGVTYMAPNEEL